MENEELLISLAEAVADGEAEEVTGLTNQAVAAKLAPLRIISEGLTRGIDVVGERFAAGDYYLPDLILGAKAMETGIAILEPLLAGHDREYLGRVLMGTVKGDLHSIGKNIVIMMLKSAGFEVFDLGEDVAAGVFIAKIRELKPDILGISALLTTTVGQQQEIIELLQEEGLRRQVKVIIGGAPINQNWADKIGADGYAEDATGAVKVAKHVLGK